MKCKHCGKDLGDYPEDDVEEGKLQEVIAHKQYTPNSLYVSKTEFYCSPKCFIEELSEGNQK